MCVSVVVQFLAILPTTGQSPAPVQTHCSAGLDLAVGVAELMLEQHLGRIPTPPLHSAEAIGQHSGNCTQMSDTPSNKAQLSSPSYRLPALDTDFILGDSARGVRFLLEYQKAEEALRQARIVSTIVVFGSARLHENGGGESAHWYAEARRFGQIASERGGALDHGGELHNVIATGGGPGLMSAANRGAHEAGAPSIGFNITLPNEQQPNAYTTPELTFRFHYFAMRKMHLAMRARGLVVFPGGFGTLDELFEVVTLQQTRKMPPCPIVLVGSRYWRSVINLETMYEAGVIDIKDLQLFSYMDSAKDAWSALLGAGLRVPA